MSDLLLEFARSKFGELNAAEVRLFQAVVEGQFPDFSTRAATLDGSSDPHHVLSGAIGDESPSHSGLSHSGLSQSGLSQSGISQGGILRSGPSPSGTSQSGASLKNIALVSANCTERVLRADRIAWLATEGGKFVTHRGIGIKGAHIEGRLDLQATNIVFALYFENCDLPAGISLLGAEIHALNLSGCQTGRISADGMKVEAGVFLRAGFKCTGRVRMAGAQIGGSLDCDRGHFFNPGSEALVADGCKIQGSVSLGDGFRADGQVRMPGAQVGGSINCADATFVFPGGDALSADRLKVEGNVFFSSGFAAEGRVALPGAQIAGYFVWSGIRDPASATLDLRSAHVGTLWMERASWPKPGKLLLHGLTYDEMDERAAVNSAERIAWLRLQPPTPFRPQPYEQLAAVLRKDGYTDEAKRILYAKELDRAQRTRLSWSEVPWYRLFGPLIGYGYKPWRALWLSVAVVLLGTALFGWGASIGIMTPTKAEAYSHPGASSKIADFYPALQPFMYSLDMFTPLISLDQADYWLPNARLGDQVWFGPSSVTTGSLLRAYMWFHIMAGWILSTLLFVGLTGSVPGA
jgi:hypothetical protein